MPLTVELDSWKKEVKSSRLSLAIYQGFPELWGKRFNGDIQFRAQCSMFSHSLHILLLWVSGCIIIWCRKKLLWWWLSKAFNYEKLWVPAVPRSHFIYFTLRPWVVSSYFLGHSISLGLGMVMGTFLQTVPYVKSLFHWLLLQALWHHCPTIFFRRHTIGIRGFCGCLPVDISFWIGWR